MKQPLHYKCIFMRNNKNIDVKKSGLSKKIALLAAFLISSANLFSQTTQAATPSESTAFSNPLFIVFSVVIIFLLIIIIVLADVVKGSARIMMEKQKAKKNGAALGVIILLLSAGFSANAQTAVAEIPTNYGGLSAGMFYTLTFVIVFEVCVIAALISFIKSFLGINDIKKQMAAEIVETHVYQPSIMEKLNASVSLEKEADILLDHNYDGIQELDNNLPPWWKYGFYLAILFAVVYLINYHVLKTGDLQGAEYTKEVAQAAIDIAEYQKNSALSVDENSVKLLSDKESLDKGKDIFVANCVACHGKFGEGQVGPNLTDDYWIHGGKINDLFKTVKYGYPEKGMKSWKEDLSPSQISHVCSYIKTLRGTNPPNPKEKQGELYVEETEKDTSAIITGMIDSTKTKVDSLAMTKK